MPQRESESLRLWQRCCASAALGVLAGQYSVAFETPELPAPASDSAEPLSCVLLTVGDHQVAWGQASFEASFHADLHLGLLGLDQNMTQLLQPLVTLSGAACAHFAEVHSNINESAAEALAICLLGYSGSLIANDTSQQQLHDAICDRDCIDLKAMLNPGQLYSMQLFDTHDAEDISIDLVTADKTSGCYNGAATVPSQYSAPSAPADAVVAVFDNELDSSLSTGSATNVVAAFTNASCAFFGVADLSLSAQPMQSYVGLFSLYLLTAADFQLVKQANLAGQAASQIFSRQIVTCDGSSCNATAGFWLKASNLRPSENYVLVQTSGSPDAAVPDAHVLSLMQPLTADRCAALPAALQTPSPANIVSLALADSTSTGNQTAQQPSMDSSSSLGGGAIAGIIIGVLVAGLGSAAAYVTLRRYIRASASYNKRSFGNSGTLSSMANGHSDEDAHVHFIKVDGLKELTMPQLQRHDSSFTPLDAASLTSPSDGAMPVSVGSQGSGLGHEHQPSNGSWMLDPRSIRISRKENGQLWRLGKGGFGEVYLAKIDTTREVAVKMSLHGPNMSQRQFWKEIQLVAELRDRNCLQFYGAALAKEGTLLVTEFCENGDLYRILHTRQNQEDHLEGQFCWHKRGKWILLGAAQGLDYLHRINRVHMDVKSPNILLDKDFTAKIADVGLARSTASLMRMSGEHIGGSYDWAAPEVFFNRELTAAADIFSFGVVMHEVITAETPKRGSLRSPSAQECPGEVAALMTRCMDPSPANRPAALMVIECIRHAIDYK